MSRVVSPTWKAIQRQTVTVAGWVNKFHNALTPCDQALEISVSSGE